MTFSKLHRFVHRSVDRSVHRPVLAAVFVLAALALALAAAAPAQAAAEAAGPLEVVELPSPESPLVAVRALFRVGSIDDPAGKEGLTALTSLMLTQAGTAERSYRELADALYPMAASIDGSPEREVTVISGESHRDTLTEWTDLFVETLTRPGWSESDFTRNKNLLQAYLTNTLRSNDELLGLEALQGQIWDGKPYEHTPAGTVQSLEAITLEDVQEHYRTHFVRQRLMLGVAGGYPEGYPARLAGRLGALPSGEARELDLGPLPEVQGRRFTLIEKETGSVGVHVGYALPITRKDPDFYPLMVASSYLGEHRTFNGRLMNKLRGERGLNYGDYSYIEYFADGPFTQRPTPNIPRHQQYFSIWIRPVVPANARFALRNALWEVDRLREEGMTEEEFTLTRDFLLNYSKLWANTLSTRLGVHMDSRYYGMPYFIDEVEKNLQAVTREQVNEAIKTYFRTDAYEAVMVTNGAGALAAGLFGDEPSPIEYGSEVSEEILAEDEEIIVREVEPTAVEIIPVAEMFEG